MTELALESKIRFEEFNKPDRNVAKISAALYVESLELHTLDPEQRVLKLSLEDKLLDADINDHKRKDYLICADNEYRIYNIFYGHHLIDHCDEEKQIFESLILHEKRNLLPKQIKNSKIQLRPFPLSGFLKGEINVIFYDLNQKPPTTSHKDYIKMRSWQMKNKLGCVNLGFGKLRERLIEKIKDSDSVTYHLMSEKQQVNDLIRNGNQLTTSQFIANTYHLRGVTPDSLPHHEGEFHQLFCKFFQGKSFYRDFSPPMLQLAFKNIRAGKISHVPIFCLSLIKYKKWLANVLDGKIGVNDPPCCDYELLFEQTFERGLVKGQKFIAEFKEKYPLRAVTQKQYKIIIFDKLKELREEFNHLEYPDYYQLLLKKENVKNYFINQTFLDVDIENHTCQLRKTIVMNEMIKFLKSELYKIDKKLIKPKLDIAEMKNHFADIISAMVPNPEISEQLWRAFNKTSLAVSGRTPILFIAENLKDSLKYIFKQALKYLKQLLDSQPDHIVTAYAVYQLRELEFLSLISTEFGEDLNEFFHELKKLLKIQLKFIPGQQSSPLVNTESPYNDLQTQVIKPERDKILAFTYNNIKGDNLSLVHKTLLHLEAIPLETTVHELREFVNGQEMSTPIKWLAGQGDLMVFIKEATSNGKLTFPYQQQWNIAVKCFVNPDESKFNATVLKASRPTNRAAKFMKAANQL